MKIVQSAVLRKLLIEDRRYFQFMIDLRGLLGLNWKI